eukprot:CAMPEP_0174584766 /NCGR_PEP_ID=MMETSP0929-20130131/18809_1 /TAXON_ID=548131 ORGANISM="Ostreococcus mediterraneus, Strain clade-D-RCC2572" /NCGR_SAMPLE_ID=MMETSP0929 /ASSEMBLY_ACC=CAM_ASM_000573 /LENGTH=159 /DNA_ID=CAMNT_0015766691 /DNA_START=22 /DNA_END=501 /DNA_ORIENTATION=-
MPPSPAAGGGDAAFGFTLALTATVGRLTTTLTFGASSTRDFLAFAASSSLPLPSSLSLSKRLTKFARCSLKIARAVAASRSAANLSSVFAALDIARNASALDTPACLAFRLRISSNAAMMSISRLLSSVRFSNARISFPASSMALAFASSSSVVSFHIS